MTVWMQRSVVAVLAALVVCEVVGVRPFSSRAAGAMARVIMDIGTEIGMRARNAMDAAVLTPDASAGVSSVDRSGSSWQSYFTSSVGGLKVLSTLPDEGVSQTEHALSQGGGEGITISGHGRKN